MGNNFCLVWDDRKRIIFIDRFVECFCREKPGQPLPERHMLERIMSRHCKTEDGMLTSHELQRALQEQGVPMTRQQMKDLWRDVLGRAAGQRVPVYEFVAIFFDEDESEAPAPGQVVPGTPANGTARSISPGLPSSPKAAAVYSAAR